MEKGFGETPLLRAMTNVMTNDELKKFDLEVELLELNIDSHKDLARREKANKLAMRWNIVFAIINSGLLIWQLILQIM